MRYRTWVAGAFACVLVAGVAPSAFAQVLKEPLRINERPVVHGFSVSLALGDMQGASSPDSLPAGAKKALADIREFLPYKSYRLLDTQWILCCGSAKVGTGVSGRLRGISEARGSDEQVYAFSVTVLNVTGSQLSVRFVMNDATNPPLKKIVSGADGSPADKELQRQADKEFHRQYEEAVSRGAGGVGGVGSVGSLKGAVIDSTFSMDVGETVVIGTSSLKGDKALIAVLTAVRRPEVQSSTNGEKR